jgi:UDP-galactopyranose mutase
LFPHNVRELSYIDDKYIRLPFNFESVQQLIGPERSVSLLAKFREQNNYGQRVPILDLLDNNDSEIRTFANLLFEKAYKTYVSKMWGMSTDKVDRYVLDRVKISLNYDERYVDKDFQYLPNTGFASLFESLINHPNIHLSLNTDALDHIQLDYTKHTAKFDGNVVDALVWTGPIDELFDLCFGELPYRSLKFTYEHFDRQSILPEEVVSYPQAIGYVRKTEYRKMMFDPSQAQGSTIVTEYPLEYQRGSIDANIPYYPNVTKESKAIYEQYDSLRKEFKNIFACGRLAEFKYYNMDVCIEHALEYFENIKYYLINKK